jgi:hypothetical protein
MKIPSSTKQGAIQHALHRGNRGGVLDPIYLYLLCSSFDAGGTIMGIKYILPSPKMFISATTAMGKTWCWVLVHQNLLPNHNNTPTCSKKTHPEEAHSPYIRIQYGGRWQCAPRPSHQRKSHLSRCLHHSTDAMEELVPLPQHHNQASLEEAYLQEDDAPWCSAGLS